MLGLLSRSGIIVVVGAVIERTVPLTNQERSICPRACILISPLLPLVDKVRISGRSEKFLIFAQLEFRNDFLAVEWLLYSAQAGFSFFVSHQGADHFVLQRLDDLVIVIQEVVDQQHALLVDHLNYFIGLLEFGYLVIKLQVFLV